MPAHTVHCSDALARLASNPLPARVANQDSLRALKVMSRLGTLNWPKGMRPAWTGFCAAS